MLNLLITPYTVLMSMRLRMLTRGNHISTQCYFNKD